MSRVFRNAILAVLLATFTVGWRSSPQTQLNFPISMTLSGERLLVSDRDTGIHVFDVTDLQAPEPIVTIPIYGNRGTAVKGDIVYANKFNRLLVIKVEGSSYEVLKVIDPVDDYGSGGIWMEGPPSRDYGYGCFCSVRSFSFSRTRRGWCSVGDRQSWESWDRGFI